MGGSIAGVTCLSKVWPACKAVGASACHSGLELRTFAWTHSGPSSRHSILPCCYTRPRSSCETCRLPGPFTDFSRDRLGLGSHVRVTLEQDSWRLCPHQFQIGRIQPCVLVPINPAKKDTALTKYPECGFGGWWHLPLPIQSPPLPSCPPTRAPASNFPEISPTNS